MFRNFDKAMDELQTYACMIEGLRAKIELDDDKLKNKRKKDVENIKDRLCVRFTNESIPKVLAKVVSYCYYCDYYYYCYFHLQLTTLQSSSSCFGSVLHLNRVSQSVK